MIGVRKGSSNFVNGACLNGKKYCFPDEIDQNVEVLFGIKNRCGHYTLHLISQLLYDVYDACFLDNDFVVKALADILS